MNAKQAKLITMPEGPDIPELCLRRYRGEADYEVLASIVQGSFDADGLDRLYTADDARRWFEHPYNCDPHEDIWFVQVGSEDVGYLEVSWRKETEGNRIYAHDGYLLAPWRRKGIGTAMLGVALERLLKIAAGHPEDGPRFFRSWADDAEEGKLALLGSHGYEPVRYFFEMVSKSMGELPEAPMPSGLEIRPANPDHYRSVWEALDEAFRDHWGHSPQPEERYQRWIKDRRFQPKHWIIAWDGDQVAGTILNYIDEEENQVRNRKRGYTEDICVRLPWRRRGLARAMLVQSIQRLKDLGMTEAALGVDTENPTGALRLYTSVGFEPVRKAIVYEKPFS
jgi:GNAT superfamily N-acetyltransferase